MAKEKPLETGLDYYKNRPLLSITGGNFRPFRMSVGKVKALLELHDKLVEFVATYDKPVEPEPVGARPIETETPKELINNS